MAICRWSRTSNVYLYEHIEGYICCCDCSLVKTGDAALTTYGEALDHLLAHRKAGHAVPDHAVEYVRAQGDKTIPKTLDYD